MEEWSFIDELKRRTPNLARAALLFSREIAYPQLDIQHYLAEIRALSVEAEATIPVDVSVHVKAELLAEFLFKGKGFQGNTAVYGDPRNSYLNEVLDRRLGIPITLSVLYVTVANYLQLPAFGVGMPGHFIVAVRSEHGHTSYFDPFHGGGRLSTADCARLVQLTVGYDGPFQEDWLYTVSSRTILTRMLTNLRISYMQHEKWQLATAVLKKLRFLQPHSTELLRDLGVVYFQQGNTPLAAYYLNEYLSKTPDASDRNVIQQGIAQVIDKWARQN